MIVKMKGIKKRALYKGEMSLEHIEVKERQYKRLIGKGMK